MYKNAPSEFSIALDLVAHSGIDLSAATLTNLRMSAEARTLTILWNGKKEPVGYVSWAGANKESVKMACQFNISPSKLWEFREGNIAFIMNVLFSPRFKDEAKAEFRKFVRARHAVFFIKKGEKRLAVRTSKGFRFPEM
ncbi:MAG TPA: hypothetical protein VN038_17055 [Dyadobacter sp.]|nr:hypothetical protein [Dyadobacter sp.]